MIGPLLIISLYFANSFLEQIQKISVTLCFHLCESRPAAASLVLIRGGKERLAGDEVHIDPLFKPVPELIAEGTLRAALLGDAVRFDTSRFLLSGEAGLTPTLRAPWAMQWRAAGTI